MFKLEYLGGRQFYNNVQDTNCFSHLMTNKLLVSGVYGVSNII